MKLEGIVELSGSCYYNMLRSAIEPFPKESVGDLLGKKLKEVFICINAYPIQTAERRHSSAHYDDSQIGRIRAINKITNTLGGLGTHLIGGYHSHVYKKNETIFSGLSETDINYRIKEEILAENKSYWIEVTLNLRYKKYQRPKQPGEFLIEYPRKLRVILRPNPYEAYDITIAAYKVDKNLRVKELKVKKRKVKVIKINS